jgi:hypothetical protein
MNRKLPPPLLSKPSHDNEIQKEIIMAERLTNLDSILESLIESDQRGTGGAGCRLSADDLE